MLAACLLAALIALAATSVLVFTPLARRGTGIASMMLGAAGLGAGAAAGDLALGSVLRFAVVAGGVLALGCVVWLPLTRRWGVVGRLGWGSAVLTSVLYLAYMLTWTFRSRLGVVGTAGGLLLWALEVAALALSLAYLWEMVDVLATGRWNRRSRDGSDVVVADEALPFVSLHVPAHNEPSEMVIETLTSLLALDYPHDRLEIVMIDDNTSHTGLWRPVADFCAQHPERIHFHHLEDWPGFKSGALNFALTVTDPRTEVVGVIDADYIVDSDYLRRCAVLFFTEPRLGFVQTPQDYREWQQARYYRRLYYSYSYFFAVSQASRNQRDGAIFGGTMGLIRRRALEEAGGWDEWCITEDAELSLRLLKRGWSGRHVDRSFGRGIMPLTFEALKRQRFRWCFGGIQILRLHWRSLVPWSRDPDNQLSQAQRWAYLSGGLQWYGDLLGLAFGGLLLVSVFNLGLGSGVVFRRLSGFLLVAVPLLVVLNLARCIALVRRATGASRRDALGAFGVWLSLAWTVANASVRGAIAPAGVFLRTPKTRGEASWRDAMRANRVELFLASLGMSGVAVAAIAVRGPGRVLLSALLVLPILGQLLAPINTLAALRAELPDDLRRRRRTERLRIWTTGPIRPTRVAAAATALIGAGIAAVFVLAPGTNPVAAPDLLHEARGHGPPSAVLPSTRAGSIPPSTAPGNTPGPSASSASPNATGATTTAFPSTSTATSATPGTAAGTAAAPGTSAPASTALATPTGSALPSASPTVRPTASPTAQPTATPTSRPTGTPSRSPHASVSPPARP